MKIVNKENDKKAETTLDKILKQLDELTAKVKKNTEDTAAVADALLTLYAISALDD